MSNIVNQTVLPANLANPASIKPCRYLAPEQAVEYIKNKYGFDISTSTLAKRRQAGKLPNFNKFCSKVYYRNDDLDDWVHQKITKHGQ